MPILNEDYSTSPEQQKTLQNCFHGLTLLIVTRLWPLSLLSDVLQEFIHSRLHLPRMPETNDTFQLLLIHAALKLDLNSLLHNKSDHNSYYSATICSHFLTGYMIHLISIRCYRKWERAKLRPRSHLWPSWVAFYFLRQTLVAPGTI